MKSAYTLLFTYFFLCKMLKKILTIFQKQSINVVFDGEGKK
jgi:hypothetical protein